MKKFDVFLCHNTQDERQVESIARELKNRRCLPWLARWELQPGLPWQRQLEQQIETIGAAAVLVGASGIGPWQQLEQEAFLREFVRRGCPVIPVILRGVEKVPRLPSFLGGMQTVDFNDVRHDPWEQLIWGLTGRKPGSAAQAPGEAPETDYLLKVTGVAGTSSKPPEKCKILFIAANPIARHQLRLDDEIREIEKKIRAAEYRDTLELVSRWAVRASDLQQALLEHRPHIVHFSGHGSPSAEIILKDRDGRGKPVSQEALVNLFTILSDRIRLVVFNSCYSKPQAEAIVGTIDCAVGMKDVVLDDTAIAFAAALYRAIGFGKSIRTAFDLGKGELGLRGIPGADLPKLIFRKGVEPSEIHLVRSTDDH